MSFVAVDVAVTSLFRGDRRSYRLDIQVPGKATVVSGCRNFHEVMETITQELMQSYRLPDDAEFVIALHKKDANNG